MLSTRQQDFYLQGISGDIRHELCADRVVYDELIRVRIWEVLFIENIAPEKPLDARWTISQGGRYDETMLAFHDRFDLVLRDSC